MEDYAPAPAGPPLAEPRRFRSVLAAAGFTLIAGALIGLASRRRLLELFAAYESALAEQRRHAASLQQRESLFTAFMDRTPGVAFMKDREGRLLYVNEGMERLFGRSRDELVGRRDEEYLPPEVARQVRENDLAVLDAGRPLQLVETVPAPDGETHRWLVCKFPFRDGAGEPLLGGVAVDVEDRERALAEVRVVNAELERRVALRTAQLTAANRELEAFSYSVSHDLRAPLRAIDGFSRAALEDHGAELGAEGREQLERVCAAARRMSQLIDDLLELSRLTRAEMARVPVDVTALARDVVADLRSTEPDRRVEVAVEEGLRANADPRLVRVLLENLLGNAWKFTSGRAEARIEVGAVGGAEAGVFFVRDNGVGFDTAQAGKLFTPFQRLHSAREFPGTGVGLASVQRVVRRHAGRVWAEAKPGAGAAFYFTLEPELPSRNGGSRASPAAEEPVENDATLRTFGA